METDHTGVACGDHPELVGLARLRARGWIFLPHVVDGEIDALQGFHTWPGGWGEAILLRGTTDAAGARTDPEGGLVWYREGTLTDVLDGLLFLPDPTHSSAPRLVIGQCGTPLMSRGRNSAVA